MNKVISCLFFVWLSIVAYAQISFFDWEYPKDVKDKNWYFIYDLVDDYQLKTCLDIRNAESLDKMVEDFKRTCESRGSFGFPGVYRLPADDSFALLMEALADMSGIENVIGNFMPDFTIAFNGIKVVDGLMYWYNMVRDSIDLDALSLYVAAKMYLACKYSPYNFIEIYNMSPTLDHFNHPLNDLDPETGEWIKELDSWSIFDIKSARERAKVDSILEAHPNNVLIKRFIQRAKVEQFTKMYRDLYVPKS